MKFFCFTEKKSLDSRELLNQHVYHGHSFAGPVAVMCLMPYDHGGGQGLCRDMGQAQKT